MSEAIAFDTHRFVKNLTGHGFTEEQAEVLATEHVTLLNSNLATKADIENLRAATKADIENLRATTKADIENLRATTKADIENLRAATKADIAGAKAELLKWMFGAMAAQTGIIVAVFKLL